MKKIKCLVASLLFAGSINAQLIDEQNVTITMDLQPILQLNMDGPSNIDFVFDEISEYVGGITKYGATTLKVSSTVNWDLYAVGYSSGNNTPVSNLVWDNAVGYGPAATANESNVLHCALLELRQDKRNNALVAAGQTGLGGADYFSAFSVAPTVGGVGHNIYTNAAPYTKPAATEKYIVGGVLTTATNFATGGTYLVLNGGNVGASSNYFYVIDYRIVPGLPAVFPNTFFPNATAILMAGVATHGPSAAGAIYARPGVYTMNVKYVLAQD